MKFVWDPVKARTNLAKHGIAFEAAQRVWDDPLLAIWPDRVEHAEQRWHAVGLIGPVLSIVVVHTYPTSSDDEQIRIIGARKASRQERRRYERQGF